MRPVRAEIIVAAQGLAIWPVWRWYGMRLKDGPDEFAGLLALATAAWLLFGQKPQEFKLSLRAPALFMLLYAASYTVLPPILRAVLAFTALGYSLSVWRFAKPVHWPLYGLLLLSLPLVPSLQFYLGYPLRVVVGGIASKLLASGGLAVTLEGTCLNWAGTLIAIDAPCSGIRMLWTSLYLACTLAALYKLNFFRTLAALMAAIALAVMGNAFRTAALFYSEAGIVALPAWTHEGAGLVVFAAMGALLVMVIGKLGSRRTAPCV